MSNERIAIRPIPKQGESLTSYLLRSANLNKYDIKDLWKKAHIGSEHALRSNQYFRLDFDYTMVDHRKLGNLLGLSRVEVQSLTLYNLHSKFLEDPYQDFDRATVMNNAFHKKSRNYCPECIKRDVFFKLIWQVKDIEICIEHNMILLSECQYCNREFNYQDDLESFKICTHSESERSFTTSQAYILNSDIRERQLKLYQRWEFLLDPNRKLSQTIGQLSLEQSLAVKVLYLGQNQSHKYDRKAIKHISISIIKNLVSLVRGVSCVKKIDWKQLFIILDACNMSIEEFSVLKVPSVYVNNIYKSKEKQKPGQCLASWCSSFGESKQIILINNRIEPRKTKVRYNYYYICNDCFMKYGYHTETSAWLNIDNKIQIIIKVQKLTSEGFTRCQILRNIGTNMYRISEIVGYLAYRHLLKEEILSKYVPHSIPEDIIQYFKQLDCDSHTYPETRYRKAQALFGWSVIEYSYYYANTDVQEYFLYKISDLKKPLKKYKDLNIRVEKVLKEMAKTNENVSISKIAKVLGCSEKLLQSRGLVSKIGQSKEQQMLMNGIQEERELYKLSKSLVNALDVSQTATSQSIYKRIGRNRDYIKKYYPDLLNFIRHSVSAHNYELKKSIVERNRFLIREAIKKVEKKNNAVNISAVAREMNYTHIFVKGYRLLKNLIEEEISNYHSHRLLNDESRSY
ncbi:TniQ family protein [Paenibacillus sp. FSL P2-0173]|uniref:TniQ family protein n=1 Tax=Paenibacillus sp. FSL P2-0173 TaxID=2921627 RepID=UPI0030F5F65E